MVRLGLPARATLGFVEGATTCLSRSRVKTDDVMFFVKQLLESIKPSRTTGFYLERSFY